MKSIVFDSGPIITFALNNLLWVLKDLKHEFNGEFYITPTIKQEIIDRPLGSKKFKFEAHQVSALVRDNIFKVYDHKELRPLSDKISNIANRCFIAQKHPITIVHDGEIEALACALLNRSSAVAIDERTTRYLIEEPLSIHKILERKLHTKVQIDKKMVRNLKTLLVGLNVLRSSELATICFIKGFFKKYELDVKNSHHELLDSLLWATKLNGCAISETEIKKIKSYVL
jgi:hypothetical protein